MEQGSNILRRAIWMAFCGLCLFVCARAEAYGAPEQETGVIRVGVYENQPKIYTAADGKVTGFFPVIFEHIARQEQWRFEYRPGTWQECLDRLVAGEIDMLMDVAFSEERRQKLDFNNETALMSWAAIYTRPDVKVQSFFDLSGRRIAVMKGSIYAAGKAGIRELLSQFNITTDYVDYASYRDVLKAVAAGEADAGVVNNVFGAYFENEYNVVRSPVLFSPSQLRFAFTKNSWLGKRLAPILDFRLHALKQDPNSIYYKSIDTYLYGTPHGERVESPVDWKTVLTVEEREWIRKHPEVRVGFDPEFYPFEFRGDKGEYEGISSDYVRLFNERLDLNLQVVKGIAWNEAVSGIQRGEIDVLPCVGFTEERSKYAVFSKPYIRFQRVILTRIDMLFVSGLRDIESLRVGVQGASSHEGFLREHSSIKPVMFATLEDCLLALSAGKTDAVVANLASATYWIRKLNLINLKVAASASSDLGTLHFAVRKDWPELATIINKGLDLVTPDEQRKIEERWVLVEYKPGFEPRLVWRIARRIAVAVVLVLLAFLIWTYQLKKEIARRLEAERILTSAKDLSERKYLELVENANSIILHWTRDGRVIFLNEFGQRFFGYTQAEILGRHVIGTIVPENETSGRDLRTMMDEICADPVRFEQNVNENMRRNGERVWIAWTNKVELDQQGQVAEILSIGLDITARKRAEEELRQTQATLERRVIERTAELAVARDRAEAADRTKSAFLATMSHELRTPLNSIIGFTGILLPGPLNAEQAKQLGMVKESGQHLLALINDVLDISKIEADELEIVNAPVDLSECIEKSVQAVKPLADKKQVPLIAQIPPDVGRITSDRRRVEQILLNLLSNAIKFTEQGTVTLTAETVPESPDGAQSAVRVSVADTGMGIKHEDLDKLFQPFRQLDTG
ncbi:MAG: transporter substrate-binding domain-containing protein, partial [Candidatus Omnitrophota bacterium]